MNKVKNLTPEILEMFDAGMSVADIYRELGVSTTAIYRVLRDNDRALPHNRLPSKTSVDVQRAICVDYESAVPVLQIINSHGISYNTLYRILAANGITLRGHSQGAVGMVEGPQADVAVSMYEAGKPLWEITSETGLHQPQIHLIMHARGIPLRRQRLSERRSILDVNQKYEKEQGASARPPLPKKARNIPEKG